MSKLKNNILFSSLLTTSNYLFPLLTFPYITRTLGVDKIGVCNWVDGIIQYFVIFSMLGVSILGVREVASTRQDKNQLNSVFSSLLVINLITTIIALLILFFLINHIGDFYEYRTLFYIGSAKLFFNFLSIEWFYKGIENFKYITYRSIFIKVIYVIAVFVFIKQPDDYYIYYILTVSSIVISSLINIIYSNKYVQFRLNELKFRRLIKPYFFLGIYLVMNSVYSTFNVAYLGIVSGVKDVGYYTTATKIFMIILSVYSAFTGVLMPRISNLISNKNSNEIYVLINKSFSVLYSIAFPLIFICYFFSPEIIQIIGGPEFNESIRLLQLSLPIILIGGIEQILVIQLLLPFKADKSIIYNSIVSVIVGVSSGYFLINMFGCKGASYAWLVTEFCILLCARYFVLKIIDISILNKNFFLNLLYSVPYIAIILSSIYLFNERFISLFVSLLLAGIYFIILQTQIIKSDIYINFFAKFPIFNYKK